MNSEEKAMSYPSKNLQILLVEDDLITRLYMRLLLQEMNCKVLFTKNGEEAVEKFSNQVDGILMNISLPGIDGREAARVINQRNPNNRAVIYALSSTALDSDSYFLEAGIQGFVQKPCLKSDLKKFLLQVSQKKHSSRGKSMSV